MLIALDKQGERVLATNAHRQQPYFCPFCHNVVILKRGKTMISHYAHKSSMPRICHHGETQLHYRAKLFIAQSLMQQGYLVEIEPYIADIQQIPDLIVNHTHAIELQFSAIPITQVINRTKGLQQAGLQVNWIVNDPQTKHRKLQLNHFQSAFIHPLERQLYTYESTQSRLYRYNKLQHLGGKSFYAQKSYVKISDLLHTNALSPQLFPTHKLPKCKIAQYIKQCRYQHSVWQPTLSAMYQLRLTDIDVVNHFGHIFPEQLYIINHPIEWQLHVELMKQCQSLTLENLLKYFKFRTFAYGEFDKQYVITQLVKRLLKCNN